MIHLLRLLLGSIYVGLFFAGVFAIRSPKVVLMISIISHSLMLMVVLYLAGAYIMHCFKEIRGEK